jgi:arylsulfatase A-like enzyme
MRKEATLTDRWVGHLLKQIDVMGLFENTCVILLSDHGMYIGEHNRCGKHTVNSDDPWALYDTVAKIPLLVWTPFDKPEMISTLVQPADIMPTILELCGIKPPNTVGKSWLPLLKGKGTKCHEEVYSTCYSGNGPGKIDYVPSHITVTTERYTAIFGRKPNKPELYDRKGDPDQLDNIADENAQIVSDLRYRLVEFMKNQCADEDYIRTYAMGE